MIKQILKIIWAQRKSNGWIYAELVLVLCVLWLLADISYVDLRTYYSPLGYDITNTWRFKLSKLNPQSPAYVPEEAYTSDPASDLLQLTSQIRQNPMVDAVCITYYSCPYSFGNSWVNIRPVDGDTLLASQESFQVRRVTKEYFDVFSVKDVEGNSITAQLEGLVNPIVITKDMEKEFFHDQSGRGRKIRYEHGGEEMLIAAVSTPIRTDEFVKSAPAFYTVATDSQLNSLIESFGADQAELCVRMKQTLSQNEMNNFLEEMGDRLTVNNLNVYGVRAIADIRKQLLKNREADRIKRSVVMGFLLVNVFFGIIGTFWLRTQHRRGETGIRIALGANRFTLKAGLYGEGLCLLLLTLPFTLLFMINMQAMDMLDTYRQAYTLLRFLATFGGTYLIMGAMICLGIWFPVQKTSRIAPAEALHYE
ncbi:MAG: ABC transporter permease [Tannerella sp.]|nr:ABC transporter permease [Tannerella sp.]